MSKVAPVFSRPYAARLSRRLAEPRRFIQVVAGPRQAGKTTLVRQVLDTSGFEAVFASADEPGLRGREWIAQQWDAARLAAREAGKRGAVLALDEIQKIPAWSETVKRLWDEDKATGAPLKVVLLGSAPLLIQHGLTESLAGSRCYTCRTGRWRRCAKPSAGHLNSTSSSVAIRARRRLPIRPIAGRATLRTP